MAWPRPMPVVEVEWVDSHVVGRWRSEAEWDAELDSPDIGPCATAGYLYRKDERGVVVMQSVSKAGQLTDAIFIPASAVTAFRVLKKAAKRG